MKRKPIILVTEDEELNFIFYREYFTRRGFEVLGARNGREAVEVCRKESKIDVVLMDLRMPVMDGYEATRNIKALKPQIPIIVNSALSFQSDIQEAYKAGCDQYFIKPIHSSELDNIVLQFVN